MSVTYLEPFGVNTSANYTFANVLVTANITNNGNVNFIGASNVSLGSNTTVRITGGSSGGVLTTNGSGSLTWSTQVANALVAGTVYTNAQPNITSVGTLVNTTLGSSNSFTGGNLVSATYLTGTLTTAAQPNVTSLGTIAGLTGTGVFNLIGTSNVALGAVGNVHITGGTSGQLLSTDGSGGLSWSTINSSGISNGTSNVNIATSGGNVTVGVGGTAGVITVTATGANISGYLNTGTGNITSGNASLGNLASATYLTGTLTTAAQPNITSVGTLVSLSVTGNITSGNAIIGSGSGGNISGANLVSANYFTGTLTTGAQPNITSVGTLTTLTSGTHTVSLNANISMSGSLSQISGANLVSANFVTTAANGNILMSGTLSQISGANLISGTYLTGTLTTAAQPNITSAGSLSGLTVSNATGIVNFTTTANVTLGAVANLHISGGTSGYVLQTDGSGTLSWVAQSGGGGGGSPGGLDTYVQFNDGGTTFGGNAQLTYNKTTNLLSVGGNLTVSGWATLQESTDLLTTKTGATGSVTHDLSTGLVFYHTSISASFTAAFTNVPTTNDRTIVVVLFLIQGATSYIASGVTINSGSAETIQWVNGITPIGNINKTDVISFTLIRTGSAWTVLGQLGTYG